MFTILDLEQEQQNVLEEAKKFFEKCFQLATAEDKPQLEDLEKVLCGNHNDETLSDAISKINSLGKLFAKLDVVEESKNFRNNVERLSRRFSLEKPSINCEPEECKLKYKATLQWLTTNGNENDIALIKQLKQHPPYTSEDVLRLFDIAVLDIKRRLKKPFHLIGYSHPFDEYPAPIVPIGYYQDKLVAVYLEPSNLSDIFLFLDRDHQYIQFNGQLKQDLDGFNYLQDKLFAFSPDKIVSYPVAKEKEFYKDVLKDQNLSQKNPFLRYSLAKTTEDTEVIQRELIQCLKYLQSESPDMIPSWYKTEKEKLYTIWQQNNLEFPSEDALTNEYSIKE